MPNGAQARGSSEAGPEAGEIRGFSDALRDQAQSYVDRRRADASRLVSDVGGAIRETGSSFDELPHLKAFFDQAALGVDGFAEDISQRSFGEMYDEVHAAVRRRPALATAAAVLAGFALFRVLRTPDVPPIPRSRAIVPVDVFPAPDR